MPQDTTTGTSLGTPLNSPSSLNYTPSNGVAPTPAPAAVAAPATVTPQPSQTQSTDVTTLGQPTLASSQLPQPSPYTPAPVPDLSTITAQGNAPTASQGQYNDITSQIGNLTSQLGGQTDYANNLQTQYNVPQLTSTANDLTANISQIQNQRDAVQQQLANQYGGDASKGYLDFEQQSVDSVLAAKQSAYASTLATINGKLSTAQSYIATAVANKYTPIENQIDALNKQAALVKGTLDNEQQKQLAVMQAQLTDRSNTIAANKAITATMLEKIATAAANAANPAPSYVVTQAQNAALGDNPASALAIIAPYLNDPNAAAAEIANINQSNASAAASYAAANKSNVEANLEGGAGPGGQALGTTGNAAIDATAPGYATTIVAAGLTQASIDQQALSYLLSGANPPIGRTGVAGAQATAIKARMGEMDPGGNIQANKAQLTSLSASLKQQTEYLNTAQRSVSNAEAGFTQVTQAFQGKVNATQFPSINAAVNAVQGQLDPGTISAYQAGLQEVANEYTQVFSRGGTATDAVRSKAASIANGDLSISDLQQVLTEVQAQGNIVVQGSQNQVKTIQDQINGILQTGGSSTTSGTTRTGTLSNGTVVTQNADGSITDAQGNKYDQNGNKL